MNPGMAAETQQMASSGATPQARDEEQEVTSPELCIEGYVVRPPSLDDAEIVSDLFNAASLAEAGEKEMAPADMRQDWQTPGFNLSEVARIVLTPEGQAVGYAELWDVPAPHVRRFAFGRVHPEHTGRGIGTAINQWIEGLARTRLHTAPDGAQVALGASVLVQNEAGQALFRSLGFRPVRHFWRMVIELDGEPETPEWPEGYRVRTMQAGEERAFFALLDDAFKDHWGHVDQPFEQAFERWLHFIRGNERCDPELFFVVEDGAGERAAAAYCLTDLPEDPAMGWVSMLGVGRDYRRNGIGLALLQHTFGAFYRRGQKRVGLGVDAESLTGATRLYERAGMHVAQERVTFEKILREGVDLSTRAVD